MPSDQCEDCKCSSDVDPDTKLHSVECTPVNCNETCQPVGCLESITQYIETAMAMQTNGENSATGQRRHSLLLLICVLGHMPSHMQNEENNYVLQQMNQ